MLSTPERSAPMTVESDLPFYGSGPSQGYGLHAVRKPRARLSSKGPQQPTARPLQTSGTFLFCLRADGLDLLFPNGV